MPPFKFENFFKPKTPETQEEAERAVRKAMKAQLKKGPDMITMHLAYEDARRVNMTLGEDLRLTKNHLLNMLQDEAGMGNIFGDEQTEQNILEEIRKMREEKKDEPQI